MSSKNGSETADSRRQLVQRVVTSSYFSKSARLSEMFLYLCHRVIDESAADIREQEVGREVFGRPVHYDTTADNIVRVHASMLRKRIDQYFSTEGSDEPLVIDIPKGNYAPIFRKRSRTEEPGQHEAPPHTGPAATAGTDASFPAQARWKRWLPTALAALFALSTCFLLVRNHRSQAPPTAIPAGQVAVHQFWSHIFAPGNPTDVVLDDAAVGLYQEITGQDVGISEYYDRSYRSRASTGDSANQLDQALTNALLLKRQASYENVALLPRLGNLAQALGGSTDVRFARGFSFRDLKTGNVILLGNSHANPWTQPFEKHLTIHWSFDRRIGDYYPVDTSDPNPDKYKLAPDSAHPHESYATVAFLPNLGGNGNILIISGTGGTATSAALDYLSTEQSLVELGKRLGKENGPGSAYFEVLLRVESRNSPRRRTTVVLCRQPHA